MGALRVALRAIEWPTDELALFATLRGPLFALDDAVLLAHKSQAQKIKELVKKLAEDKRLKKLV